MVPLFGIHCLEQIHPVVVTTLTLTFNSRCLPKLYKVGNVDNKFSQKSKINSVKNFPAVWIENNSSCDLLGCSPYCGNQTCIN